MTATFKKHPLPLLGLAAAGLLAIAYGFQAAGYLPCELCWWQRYPYFAIVGLSVIGMLLGRRVVAFFIALIGLLYAVDLGIAIFHVGVEQQWWAGLDSCSGLIDIKAMSAEELLEYMSTEQPPRCDEAAWDFAGVSMAGWNGVAALAMTLISVIAFHESRQTKRLLP